MSTFQNQSAYLELSLCNCNTQYLHHNRPLPPNHHCPLYLHCQIKLFKYEKSVQDVVKMLAESRCSKSLLTSSPVPVLGSSGLGPWTGPVLIFPNMEGPWTGPHKTGFTQSSAVLGLVLVKTDS